MQKRTIITFSDMTCGVESETSKTRNVRTIPACESSSSGRLPARSMTAAEASVPSMLMTPTQMLDTAGKRRPVGYI